jgi:outer membrane protein assembly factor BamB
MRHGFTALIWLLSAAWVAGCGAAEPPAAVSPDVAVAPQPDADQPACFWPRFHGPHNDNISTERGLAKTWPEDGPPLVWTAEGIGQGYSGVSLAAGRIFTAGNIGDETIVTALSMAGEILWQVPAGPAWRADYPGTRATPTIDGERLYYQSPHGDLVCLKVESGERLWAVNVLERFGAPNIRWALAESVLIDGQRVISTPGGPRTAMVALDKMTGQTVWQSESADGDAAGYATPALVEYEGKRLLLTMTAKAVICVDADSGKLYWRFPHETSYDVNVLRPIFHEGRVFVSTGYGAGSRMLRMSVEGDRIAAEQVWTNRDLDNHHGGVVLVGGHLYGSSHRGRWVCLDWSDGTTRYAAEGVGKGSLTLADGMFYCLGERSRVGLVECTPEEHRLVAEFRLPPGGDGPSWAHPVVCGGRLYLRHDDFLYCYDVTAK